MSRGLRERLQADLRVALARRDVGRLSVLRTTLAALSNAEAVDPSLVEEGVTEEPRRELADEEIRRIVQQERDELRLAAARMRRVAVAERARDLLMQAQVLDEYLHSAQQAEPVEDDQPVS